MILRFEAGQHKTLTMILPYVTMILIQSKVDGFNVKKLALKSIRLTVSLSNFHEALHFFGSKTRKEKMKVKLEQEEGGDG